ncbi:MAG: transcriptional regulator [Gammaproteobacteria bacterium]|nr:MAG: transcriptional regulator [Gammaproteobacteria bacterium]
MRHTTNIQVINQGGKPAFVVVPYDEWLAMRENSDNEVYTPQEVMELIILKDMSHIAAWRKYKKITQKDLAKAAGITQAAMSQIEKTDSEPQKRTLSKIAKALGVTVEHLTD